MKEVKYLYYKIADDEAEIEFQHNDIAVIEVNGKTICVGKYGGDLFAFPYKCPHAAGLLVNGWIDAKGNVVCPLHQYKFSLATGKNVTGEGYYMKRWPVEKRGDEVYVGLETGGLFSWF